MSFSWSTVPWHYMLSVLTTKHDACNAVEVQKTLLAEEQQAHQLSSSNSSTHSSGSSIHKSLLQLHQAALHQEALLQHAECCAAPALATMQQLSVQADLQVQQLEAENNRLQVRPNIRTFSLSQDVVAGCHLRWWPFMTLQLTIRSTVYLKCCCT